MKEEEGGGAGGNEGSRREVKTGVGNVVIEQVTRTGGAAVVSIAAIEDTSCRSMSGRHARPSREAGAGEPQGAGRGSTEMRKREKKREYGAEGRAY